MYYTHYHCTYSRWPSGTGTYIVNITQWMYMYLLMSQVFDHYCLGRVIFLRDLRSAKRNRLGTATAEVKVGEKTRSIGLGCWGE